MIDIVLVKRDMMRHVQDVRAVREMRHGLPDHYVVLYNVKLVGAWIKRREVVVGPRKLREHQYREGYTRSLEREGNRMGWR